jgi:hypothetical protein
MSRGIELFRFGEGGADHATLGFSGILDRLNMLLTSQVSVLRQTGQGFY